MSQFIDTGCSSEHPTAAQIAHGAILVLLDPPRVNDLALAPNLQFRHIVGLFFDTIAVLFIAAKLPAIDRIVTPQKHSATRALISYKASHIAVAVGPTERTLAILFSVDESA